MPRALDITCDVSEEGKLPLNRTRQIREYLKFFAEGRVRIRISAPKRSTKANAYLWGVVYPTIQAALADVGQAVSCKQIHWLMKERYLPTRVVQVLDGEVPEEPSSSKLDSTEFYEFVEAIRYDEAVLALGVEIPDPDPFYRSYRIEVPA